MPSLTLPDRFIWFAHCPKAGGTSIEQFMVARWGGAVGHLHWGWDLWWRRGGWQHASPPSSPQHFIWADACPQFARPPDAVFAVVRDPVARMESEYRWQRQGRRGTCLGRALSRLSFSFWLKLMLEASRLSPYVFDNHFRPQSDFVPKGAQVFHLENGLQPAIDWLLEMTGEPLCGIPMPHSLAGQGSVQASPDDHALIASTFAEDYRRFGYCRPFSDTRSGATGSLARLLAPIIVFLDRHGAL